MTQEQEHNERPRFGGTTAEQVGRARAGSGEGAGGRFERLRDALVTLLRRLGEKAASASRWLRRRLRFGLSSILDTFRRWSKGRGFGFWWLVVTLVLAGVVGVLVAALLTPVMGILAWPGGRGLVAHPQDDR